MRPRPDVQVITRGIREVREHSVVDREGRERPVDAPIFGTGFRINDLVPRLFILVGPNTGLGHNSIISMIESQLA